MSRHEQLHPTEQLSAIDEQFAAISHDAHSEEHVVAANAQSYDVSHELARGTINDVYGVEQGIHGVVKAGDELFGVVKASVKDASGAPVETFVLSRFGKEGERAQIVGLLQEGAPLSVGRDHQEGLSDTTSRNHFKIGMFEGKLVLEDSHSTNGTELITGSQTAAEVAKPQDEGRFMRRALHKVLRRHKKQQAVVPAVSPLEDFKTWAPKSAEIRELVIPTAEVHAQPIVAVQPEVARVSTEQEPDQTLEQFAGKVDAISEAMSHAIKITTRPGNEKVTLDTNTLVNLMGSSDFVSRSVLAALKDLQGTGIAQRADVRKALKSAFDLEMLPTNTMPREVDWESDTSIIKHAELIQNSLHGLKREEALRSGLQWAVPSTLGRLTGALSSIAHAAARDSVAAPRFAASLQYHAGNLKTPEHFAEALKAKK